MEVKLTPGEVRALLAATTFHGIRSAVYHLDGAVFRDGRAISTNGSILLQIETPGLDGQEEPVYIPRESLAAVLKGMPSHWRNRPVVTISSNEDGTTRIRGQLPGHIRDDNVKVIGRPTPEGFTYPKEAYSMASEPLPRPTTTLRVRSETLVILGEIVKRLVPLEFDPSDPVEIEISKVSGKVKAYLPGGATVVFYASEKSVAENGKDG